MDEIFNVLVAGGPFWMKIVFFASIIGAVSWVVINRQYVRMQRVHYENQLAAKEEAHASILRERAAQLDEKDRTLAMFKSSKDEQTQILLTAKNDATRERDMYRDRLHEEKANHQATLARLNLAEERPDLSQIMSVTQRTLEFLQGMQESLTSSASICSRTVKMVDGVIDHLIKKKVLPENFNID